MNRSSSLTVNNRSIEAHLSNIFSSIEAKGFRSAEISYQRIIELAQDCIIISRYEQLKSLEEK